MKRVTSKMSEESGITYEQKGDYYYPVFAETKQTCYPIGKYGNLRLTFIKEHRKGTYTTLLTTGRLNEYLYKVDMEAKETVRRLTAEFAKARGIDEKLKSSSLGARDEQLQSVCRGNCDGGYLRLNILRIQNTIVAF